ncbi:energy-coupling factor transporter transmembrane component T family protein [Haemophilus haemolyticus]|uniref:energy-coupling factor transporter transmembrane component T family protein n=1 Tax=Haemophilus haemolyticus TaxID=726 RepID=UPI000E57636A|nr:energy-coupling factor transporter transmembrane component T [Haemophilus haemolyticus]
MKIHCLFQPHFRLIYLFIWGLIISGLSDLTWLIPLNVLAVSLFFISQLFSQKSFLPYLKRWFALIIFIALMWATLSWKIGENGIELNFQGIELVEKLSLRTHLLLISLWLFLWNINDAVLVQAIGKLPLPEKLIQLFVLTVRYIALLGELRQKMDIAMRARGFRPRLNRRTLYVTAQRVALLLIHALLKAETAQMALKCRGFQFGKKREK